MKFLKTIRFDASDTQVFDVAAEPGEWALPGTFWFQSMEKKEIKGKTKQAFANGFLSIESFGFSTLVSITEIEPGELNALKQRLTEKFLSDFGAPREELAMSVANDELQYTVEMCADVPVNSIFAIRREFEADDQIRESFSLVEPPTEKTHTKIWEIIE